MILSFRLPEQGELALSAAEHEVLQLLLAGCSQQQIAERRGTARRTVANQVACLFRKLQIHSRSELAGLQPLLRSS